MTAPASEYDVLVVKRMPTFGNLAFTYEEHMFFDKIPVHVLFPESSVPDGILEVGFRFEGEHVPFLKSRRDALLEWFHHHTSERRYEQ